MNNQKSIYSPGIADQAAIIPDRVECLYSPVMSTGGMMFTGDHPAKQFERGTQIGGTYKCGGFGCKGMLMDDQAHALRCKTKSLHELQAVALQGKLGRVPQKDKPLYVPDLTVEEIRKELQARNNLEVH